MATAIHQANYDIDEELFAELRELEALCGGSARVDVSKSVVKTTAIKPKVVHVEGYNSSYVKAKPPVQVEAYVPSPTASDTRSVCTDVSDESFSELTHHITDNRNNASSSEASADGSKFNFRKLVSKENAFQDVVTKAEKTIAELFPEATVLFADISGFTAWSSIREATQVFTLLEAIFQSFDVIANELGVFKVETVGDCYVAVCGLPEVNTEHAIVMSKFARACVIKFQEVVQGLEMVLGPDTGELAIRIGLNSGPVTAGVIRGERARLQLFGDTVNTAARIESTGERSRIHLSEQTANLLKQAGYEGWVQPRRDIVSAKGKGRMKTFWLNQDTDEMGTMNVRSTHKSREDATLQERLERCIDWNTELLVGLLKKVVAHRVALHGPRAIKDAAGVSAKLKTKAKNIGAGQLIVEEVANIIELPEFDDRATAAHAESLVLPAKVVAQCRRYVAVVASMYRNNAFHNFEHATHVTMSVHKLLSRIVAPKLDATTDEERLERLKHDHTYGITSDPLTQFSVVLSALVHDADHRGVPNNLLAAEDKCLATVYKNKSVAEQNSVEVAWEALLADEFEAFRVCIFGTDAEMNRFRKLLVNSVIATDIFDREQSTLRKNRWNVAFSEDSAREDQRVAKNRKATIVIEHLIQASDVSHCMQHWHVYQKWNERLFHEMYDAFLEGRSDKDPSEGWYKGEIWFFDNYIIPLAKKLKNCGVFGVSSDEYLMYATTNRNEWVIKGETIVAEFKEKYSR